MNASFRGLLHFTDFSNLNSIINIGYLLSRALCYAYNIEFFDVANGEEYANDYVKFCLTEKNDDALYRLKTPVYLLFSQDLIKSDFSMFSNKANKTFKINKDIEFIKDTSLFVAEPVSLKQLKKIIFRCDGNYKRACYLFGKNKLYTVEPDMFFHEDNYIKDYSIYYDSEQHKDLFVLHFKTNLPVKNDSHEYKLYDLDDNIVKSAKFSFLESHSTNFNLEIAKPEQPVKFKLWFYGNLCIEETVG